MCNHRENNHINEEEDDMEKPVAEQSYKKLNLDPETIEKISVTPKVKDGKLLFDRKDKSHRCIVDDD